MKRMLHEWGWVPSRGGRGLLIAVNTVAPDRLVEVVRARFPRLNLFVLGESPRDSQGDLLLKAWPRSRSASLRLMARARISALVVDDLSAPAAPLVAAAVELGLPVVRFSAGSDPVALCESIASEIAVKHRHGKERRPIERLARWLALESPLAGVLQRKFELIPDLPALRRMLGEPDAILCLGNGPSSESPGIREQSHDAVLRVNHGWLKRPFLPRADCVFTGLRDTVAAVPSGTALVFPSLAHEADMRYRCATLPGPIRYSSAERLEVLEPDGFEVFRPSNGAIMIAVAVALQPRRLIIGGIDLFSHPSGAYPGDEATPNAYTIGHDRSTELSFILRTLDEYQGELLIFGDVLRRAWSLHEASGERGNLHTSELPGRGLT